MSKRKQQPVAPKKTRAPVEHLDSMPAPNHRASLFLFPEDYTALKRVPERLYALMKLMLPDGDSGSRPKSLLFVDEHYGLTHWSERADCPPTWMDPERFIRFVLTDNTIQQIADGYLRKKTAGGHKQIKKRLHELFETHYLPYLQERFAEASLPLAQWLTAYLANKKQHEPGKRIAKTKTATTEKAAPSAAKAKPGSDRAASRGSTRTGAAKPPGAIGSRATGKHRATDAAGGGRASVPLKDLLRLRSIRRK